jgi:hypothetical protein
VSNKSTKKAIEPDEQITIKSPVAILKDLVTKGAGKQVFLLFLSGLAIIAIMVYVTLVLVQVPFL